MLSTFIAIQLLFWVSSESIGISTSFKKSPVAPGSEVIVTCISPKNKFDTVRLFKDGEDTGINHMSVNPQFRFKDIVPGPYLFLDAAMPDHPHLKNFKFTNVSVNDTGIYNCIHKYSNGTIEISENVTLIIEDQKFAEYVVTMNSTNQTFHFEFDGSTYIFEPKIHENSSEVICHFPSSSLQLLNSTLQILANGTNVHENFTRSYKMKTRSQDHSYVAMSVYPLLLQNNSVKNATMFRCALSNNQSHNYTFSDLIMGILPEFVRESNDSLNGMSRKISSIPSTGLGAKPQELLEDNNTTSSSNFVQQQLQNISNISWYPLNSTNSSGIVGVYNYSNFSSFGKSPKIYVSLQRIRQDLVAVCTAKDLSDNQMVILEKLSVPIPTTGSNATKDRLEIRILNVRESEISDYGCIIYDGNKTVGNSQRFRKANFNQSEEVIQSSNPNNFRYTDMYPMIYLDSYKSIEYLSRGSKFVKKCIAKGIGHDRLRMFAGRKRLDSDPRVTYEENQYYTMATLRINSTTTRDYGKYECRVEYGKINMRISFLLQTDKIF